MKRTLWVSVMTALCVCLAIAQQSPTPGSAANAAVPSLVNFSGTMTDASGRPLTGIVGVTFSLYREQQGGAPLWLETQNVQADRAGRYSVMLGSTRNSGLPADIFVAGEARWLGVQVQGQAEGPRVMLVAVPYALKAADAETIGGLPPSAFLLATSAVGTSNASSSGGNKNAASTPPPTAPAAIKKWNETHDNTTSSSAAKP
jgi:hypothetical protein